MSVGLQSRHRVLQLYLPNGLEYLVIGHRSAVVVQICLESQPIGPAQEVME